MKSSSGDDKSSFTMVLLAVLLVLGCSPQDNTKAINTLLKNAVNHAEAHRIGDLLDLTTSGFIAMPGRYNRTATRGILYRTFQYYGNFNVYYPRPSIHMEEQNLQSDVTVYFMLVRQDAEFPDLRELADNPQQWLKTAQQKADLYQLKLELIKVDKKWLVQQAHIQGFKGTGFKKEDS